MSLPPTPEFMLVVRTADVDQLCVLGLRLLEALLPGLATCLGLGQVGSELGVASAASVVLGPVLPRRRISTGSSWSLGTGRSRTEKMIAARCRYFSASLRRHLQLPMRH